MLCGLSVCIIMHNCGHLCVLCDCICVHDYAFNCGHKPTSTIPCMLMDHNYGFCLWLQLQGYKGRAGQCPEACSEGRLSLAVGQCLVVILYLSCTCHVLVMYLSCTCPAAKPALCPKCPAPPSARITVAMPVDRGWLTLTNDTLWCTQL